MSRSAEARLRPQHAPDRPQRSGRPARRRAAHGASRLRLYRPHVLQGLQRRRRARSEEPEAGDYFAAPPDTWNIHLQTHGDLLLVINAKDMFAAAEFADERAYYKGQLGKMVGTAGQRTRSRARLDRRDGGLRHLASPREPRQIGFMPVEGGGIHRIWYTGGRWAYASALIDGFTDYIFITIDMADPAKPREAGRWWIPGMNQAAGETPYWPATSRFGLHHPIVHGDTAYGAWRDAGMVVLDVADRASAQADRPPQLGPPFGGGTHNCLPLPDRELLFVLDEAVLDQQEDGLKLIWLFDNRVRPTRSASRPSRCRPKPTTQPRAAISARTTSTRTGPARFVSSELIFATYQNAGVRVYDIRDQYQPVEVGACVPPRAGEADRPPPRPRPGHPVLRRLRRHGGADLRHRLQWRAVDHGIRRLTPQALILRRVHRIPRSWHRRSARRRAR